MRAPSSLPCHDLAAATATTHRRTAALLRSLASVMKWRYVHEALWMRVRALGYSIRALYWDRQSARMRPTEEADG